MGRREEVREFVYGLRGSRGGYVHDHSFLKQKRRMLSAECVLLSAISNALCHIDIFNRSSAELRHNRTTVGYRERARMINTLSYSAGENGANHHVLLHWRLRL